MHSNIKEMKTFCLTNPSLWWHCIQVLRRKQSFFATPFGANDAPMGGTGPFPIALLYPEGLRQPVALMDSHSKTQTECK
jgi:hypothetical protein